MTDVFDYLSWRGDLNFSQDGMNEVDALVFSCLSYLDYTGVVGKGCASSITLKEAAQQIRKPDTSGGKNLYLAQFPELLEAAAASKRFQDVRLSCFVSELDIEKPNQFAAVAFSTGKRTHFLAFRGTDDNLAGWKEDFLMSVMDEVPAQSRAAAYLRDVAALLPGRLHLGGHSKGGNLAVYAASQAPGSVSRRIGAVYNNDGPGFLPSIIGSDGYRRIVGRVRTIMPKNSVVGLLLEHGAQRTVVSTSQKMLLSHNPLTWGVLGKSFIEADELTRASIQFSRTLSEWLGELPLDKREQFVEALFDILEASGAQTVTELTTERLGAIDAMLRKLRSMDKQTRTLLRESIVSYFNTRYKVFRESIGDNLEALTAPKKPPAT